MKSLSILGLACAAFLTAAPAMATIYHCKLTESGRSNFIPREVLIDYNQSSGQVRVIDRLIEHYFGAPINGKVAVKNSHRITFSWTLQSVKGTGANGASATLSRISYRLTVQNGSHAATISAVIASADNKPSGSGRCELRN